MRLGHRLAVPVIHTEHGGGYVATSSRLVESAARVVDLTVGRAVLRGASEVLAVSQASCEFVKRLSGVDATLFHNGVDIESWLPEATRSATASAKGRSLVFVGRLVPEKGWRSFLHIARACREAGFLGPVVLLGDGPDREKAASYAQTLGILDAQLPGHVPSAVVRDHLRGGILVNPTTASEGFQLTLVEAMACGAAIATYAVGGTEEIAAVPGAVVSVVPVGDETLLQTATLDLLSRRPSDPDLGVLWTWDWSRVADAYVAVLERASSSVGG
jgi:glycosyltransferase involved in cell wall biosynthesis